MYETHVTIPLVEQHALVIKQRHGLMSGFIGGSSVPVGYTPEMSLLADVAGRERRPIRAGYMGHLTEIANSLQTVAARRPPVAQLLCSSTAWTQFAFGPLSDRNQVRPLLAANFSVCCCKSKAPQHGNAGATFLLLLISLSSTPLYLKPLVFDCLCEVGWIQLLRTCRDYVSPMVTVLIDLPLIYFLRSQFFWSFTHIELLTQKILSASLQHLHGVVAWG